MAGSFSTAIVVGASSGIGEAMVRQLAAAGTRVAAVARRRDRLDGLAAECGEKVVPYVHDVRDFGSAPGTFDRIVADFGSVDLLIYNAGVMPRVEEGEYNFEKDREMMEVNVLGAMAWINPCAAYMEARRSGTIAGISSVAGDRGRRGNPGYHTSKAALTCYLEAIRNRVARHGVTVVTIKPGPVNTPMTTGLKLPLMIQADEAARGALAHVQAGSVEAYVPAVWGPIMTLIRLIPSSIFRRTNI